MRTLIKKYIYSTIEILKLSRRFILNKLIFLENKAIITESNEPLIVDTIGKYKINKNNLVMGLALNYKINDINIFVKSLRAVDSSCRVILVCSRNIDTQTIEYLDQNKIEFVKWNYYNKSDSHLLNERHRAYSLILQSLETKPSNILIADVRDVFFQFEFFSKIREYYEKYNLNKKIIFFSETDNKTIGSCLTNSFWFKYSFGSKKYKKVLNEKVLCAGTLIGDYKEIINYLNLQADHLQYICSRKLFGRILDSDQAIHNHIYYYDLKSLDQRNIDNSFFVSTLANLDISQINISNPIRIKDVPSHILHQYDRIIPLNNFINNLQK